MRPNFRPQTPDDFFDGMKLIPFDEKMKKKM